MKKLIALSALLAMGALGMACGDAAPANNATNKPANATNNTAPTNTAPVASPAANTNTGNANATHSNTNSSSSNSNAGNSNAKPAGNTNTNAK